MSEDTRIVINAGGRVFETSTTTLKLSGAGYFEALLGDTGTQMRGKKRARPGDDAPEVTGSAEDDAPSAPREIFIDRDPDCFQEALKFLRNGRKFWPKTTDQIIQDGIDSEIRHWGLHVGWEKCKALATSVVHAIDAVW